MYFVYLLRCRDNSLYCGTAAAWEKRISVHFSGGAGAARYTRSHPPLRPEAVWQCPDKGEALKLEHRIKQLSRAEKAALIASGGTLDPACVRLPDSSLVSSRGLW